MAPLAAIIAQSPCALTVPTSAPTLLKLTSCSLKRLKSHSLVLN